MSETSRTATLRAFVAKEVRHLLRDRQTFVILLFLPLAQLILFGYAVRTDIHAVRVALVAASPDEAVTSLAARLRGSGRFQLLPPVPTAEALEAALRRGDADVGIVTDAHLASRLASGEATRLLVVTDATDPNTGTVMGSYVEALLRDWLAERGPGRAALQVEVRQRMRFNPTLESVNLFVPGLVALILTLTTSLMTALSLSREKERGTFEVLLVSPLRPWQIIVGKVLPYLALAMANVAMVLVAAVTVFGVPFRGSVLLLLGSSVLFALVGLSVGILIAAVTSTQLAAMLAALGGTMLPNTMLSGLIFPIASMPRPLQLLTNVVPARWFIPIVRGIMLKGVGLETLWPHHLALLARLVLLLAVAIRRTSVRLA